MLVTGSRAAWQHSLGVGAKVRSKVKLLELLIFRHVSTRNACVEQHFETIDVVVGTGHVQGRPVVEVKRLQTSVHCDQQFHTVCVFLAPCSSSSLTHSKLPAEQVSHRGVLPSTFRAST